MSAHWGHVQRPPHAFCGLDLQHALQIKVSRVWDMGFLIMGDHSTHQLSSRLYNSLQMTPSSLSDQHSVNFAAYTTFLLTPVTAHAAGLQWDLRVETVSFEGLYRGPGPTSGAWPGHGPVRTGSSETRRVSR